MNRNNGVRLADKDWEFVWCELKARLMKRKVILELQKDKNNTELMDISSYLRNNSITVFPYNYTKRYNLRNIDVTRDEKTGLYYVMFGSQKLYMRSSYKSKFRVQRYFNNLLIEQDKESPHRYLTDEFKPDEDSVVLDIGGAEGLFAGMVVDKVKKVYIFECDDRWIHALNESFKEYGDKVEIVKRFVDGFTDEEHTTIDDFVRERELDKEHIFVKIDAEGSEPAIVKGACNAINNGTDMKFAICTYHCAEHENMLRKYFAGWNIQASNGYMLYYYDYRWQKPYIRRGVLRIHRD